MANTAIRLTDVTKVFPRDVIAFPKVQTAADLMMSCPDVVDGQQLDDLSIAVTRREPRSASQFHASAP